MENTLATERVARNLSLRKAARKIGCSLSILSMAERGYTPQVKTAWKIVKFYWPDRGDDVEKLFEVFPVLKERLGARRRLDVE